MQTHIKKRFIKETTADAVRILFEQAEKNSMTNPKRTDRYIEMIWNAVKKHKIRLTPDQKKRFCRKCRTFFILGHNATVTFHSRTGAFYTVCKKCTYSRRI